MINIKKNIKKLGAGLMASLCAFSMLSTSLSTVIPVKAAITTENAAFPTSDEIIAQASTLLGSPYGWGFKGYTGVYYQGSYSPLSLDYVRNQGVDCSGLLYYTLTHLGYSTSGFSWNNPVPVDTTHWLSINDNCTITYNGITSKIDVEKANIPYTERPYWECADGSTITPGSMVIADNLAGEDHSWIYIGEFNSRNDVISYLKKIGVNESYINDKTVGDGNGDGGTHWRIESNGSQGCVINNRTDGKKATAMNMYAFRVTQTNVEFSVTKLDKDTQMFIGKSPVDNSSAIYGVYSDKECKNKVGEITIGEKGKGSIKLPNGTYFAKEIKAPTGYDLDTTVYTLKSGQTITALEDRTTAKIVINKIAEDNVIENREFKITSSDGREFAAKTNVYGEAEIDGLFIYDSKTGKPIIYTISEINVDPRYVTPEPQNVTLVNGDVNLTAGVKFENKLKKFTVEVVKKDRETVTAQGEASLAGASYGLYHDGERIATYTTDENGHFITDEFACGNYTLQELTPSQGYLLNDEIYSIGAEPENYIIETNPISIDVTEDVIKGNISIIKHSDDDDTTINYLEKDAEFEVYLKSAGNYNNAKETERDYLITDENGFAKTKNMPYGIYTVHQTKTVNDASFVSDFDVNIIENSRTYEYILNNKPFKSYIHVTKLDAETGKVIPYEGAGFQIYDSNNKIVNLGTDIFYTDNSGCLITPDSLRYGDYTLVEVQAPIGYVLDSTPVPFTVSADNADKENSVNIIRVTKADTAQKGRISVTKSGDIFSTVEYASSSYTDEDGNVVYNPVTYMPVFENSGLKGAIFEITATEDIYTADGTLRASSGEIIDTITTDENGYAVTAPLYLGKYAIKEINAPYGYILNDEIKNVELTYAGQEIAITDAINSTFFNDNQGLNIHLTKSMEYDNLFDIGNNGEYRNVIFGLYAAENIKAADGTIIPKNGLITEVKIGDDMTTTIKEKLPFSKYYVQEIATDEHYIINGEKYLVNFEYMGQKLITVDIDCGTFINIIKRGSVTGKKINENGVLLENALFGLFKADETIFTAENAFLTSKTDANGIFSFADIPYGEYIIKEIIAPTGYILSNKQYPVIISENGDIVEIIAKNHPISVAISKEDLYGKELAGANMQLLDDNNTVIDEWISDGTTHLVSCIPAGSYTLKEIAAPDGYIIATDISFNIDEYGKVTVDGIDASSFSDDGVPCITMTDNTTLVKVSKQDITTGAELSGAMLQVIEKNGNIVEEWISSTEPHYIESKLIAGKNYILRETAAPQGYTIANDIEFTVNSDGSVTEVIMKDEAIVVNVPPTGDMGKDPFGFVLMIAGLILLTITIFRKKKTVEPADEYAALCPEFIERKD